MWITYTAVFLLSFVKVLKISILFRQDQDQDFFFKNHHDQDFHFKTETKTKTILHVLEAPRDQDQGLETTHLPLEEVCRPLSVSASTLEVADSAQ